MMRISETNLVETIQAMEFEMVVLISADTVQIHRKTWEPRLLGGTTILIRDRLTRLVDAITIGNRWHLFQTENRLIETAKPTEKPISTEILTGNPTASLAEGFLALRDQIIRITRDETWMMSVTSRKIDLEDFREVKIRTLTDPERGTENPRETGISTDLHETSAASRGTSINHETSSRTRKEMTLSRS